jgi:bacterioferritin-associated ferredoxin
VPRIGGDRVFVCSCFGITEEQVKQHADAGRCTPRQIASACKAGTDCGSCVRRIQALLGRGDACVTRARMEPGPQLRPQAGPELPPVPQPEPLGTPRPGPAVPPAVLPAAAHRSASSRAA